jgi:hypothetical protein
VRGKNSRAKKLLCLNNNKIYNCIKDASEELNIASLAFKLRHNKSTGTYQFIYLEEKI